MLFFLQLLFAGISLGAVYAVVAHGFNATYWTVRVVNFSHGSFLMMTVMLSLAAFNAGMPLGLAILLGCLMAGVMGYILERVAVRPIMNRLTGMGWIVTTLGAGVVMQALATEIWGSQAMAFPAVIFSTTDYVEAFNVKISAQLLLVLLTALLVMGLFEFFVRRTLWGKAVAATAYDSDCARLVGINVRAVITFSFIASAVLAGIAGVLVAPITGVDPAFGLDLMIKGFVAAVLGGMGSATGALVGGILLGVIELMAGGYASSVARNEVSFLLLVIVLLVKPAGLFGKRMVVKV